MIYNDIHIENMFWKFVLKLLKFTSKAEVSFLSQFTSLCMSFTGLLLICPLTLSLSLNPPIIVFLLTDYGSSSLPVRFLTPYPSLDKAQE